MSTRSVKKVSKKEVKVLIYNKIADALSEYKKELKPKKFESSLKKASKLFAADIAKASTKHLGPEKKSKKKVVKSTAKKHAVAVDKEVVS